MNNQYDYIYLSPHLDDAVLSCGSMISKQKRQNKKILIITIFAGVPKKNYKLLQSISGIIKDCGHKSCIDFCRDRINEDINAAKLLNIDFKHLNFFDAIYRKDSSSRFIYKNLSRIFNARPSRADNIKEFVWKIINRNINKTSIIYCPLSTGGHVDHVIVRQIGNLLRSQKRNILFYKDICASHSGIGLYSKNYKFISTRCSKYTVSDHDMVMHQKAINCYKTQINGLIKSTNMSIEDMVKKINHSSLKGKFSYINLWRC